MFWPLLVFYVFVMVMFTVFSSMYINDFTLGRAEFVIAKVVLFTPFLWPLWILGLFLWSVLYVIPFEMVPELFKDFISAVKKGQ